VLLDVMVEALWGVLSSILTEGEKSLDRYIPEALLWALEFRDGADCVALPCGVVWLSQSQGA